MALSTDIALRRTAVPRFPQRCIYSGERDPDATVTVWTHTLGWQTWVLLSFGSLVKVTVPIRKRYKFRFLWQCYGRWFVSMILILVAVALVYPWVKDLGAWRRYIAVGVTLIALSPYFLWETLFPPAFDITAYRDRIEYEFKDESYALEFAELNVDELAGSD